MLPGRSLSSLHNCEADQQAGGGVVHGGNEEVRERVAAHGS